MHFDIKPLIVLKAKQFVTMKVVVAKDVGYLKTSDHILPLQDDPNLYKLDKTNSVSWDLRTIPADANSPTYKFQARILQGDETPRQMIRWRLDVMKVWNGLNLTDYDTRRPIVEAMLRPGPLAQFHASLHLSEEADYEAALNAALITDQAAGDTVASDAVVANGVAHYAALGHLDTAIGYVISMIMPRKVLARVKRALRREMRKPADMKVRTYFQNLQRINVEEIPNLPPFQRDQHLTDDEMLDILLYGTPRSWQKEMERQGYDPMDHSIFQLVDFMENLENTEDDPKKSDKSKDKKKSSDKPAKKKAPYFCKQHGPNYTHDTKDCKFLANQSNGNKGSYSNKTWTRKAQDNGDKAKKELAAMIGKATRKAVKQLAAAEKKRKSDDSDDEGNDCFLVETLTKDLDGFNYDDMEKLSINEKGGSR